MTDARAANKSGRPGGLSDVTGIAGYLAALYRGSCACRVETARLMRRWSTHTPPSAVPELGTGLSEPKPWQPFQSDSHSSQPGVSSRREPGTSSCGGSS